MIASTTSDGPAIRRPQPLALGVSLLPATNPLNFAKSLALLLAPVKVPVPISVATLIARALLNAISMNVRVVPFIVGAVIVGRAVSEVEKGASVVR